MEDSFFKGEVRLVNAKIGGNFNCKDGEFINPKATAINAEGIEVNCSVIMSDGFQVNGKVNLISAEIKKNFIWKGFNSSANAILDLRSAKIGTLWDDEASWPKRNNLFLCGLSYKEIHEKAPITARERIKWLDLQDPNRFLPQPYEELAAVLRHHGHYEDYKEIQIRKTDEWIRSTKAKMSLIKRFGYFILKHTIGYGYHTLNVFYVGLLIVIIGGYIYYLANERHLMVKIKERDFPLKRQYPSFYSFIYSIDAFTPVVNLHQVAYYLPAPGKGFVRNGLRFFLYFQIITGWIIVALFLASISGLAKI